MSKYHFDLNSLLTISFFAFAFLLIPLSSSCSAFVRPMNDDDALKTLRDLTKNGKLPPENVVLEIENRFAKTKSGALAKLLRARIRFENNDFNGAAQILNTNLFKEKTELGDYALWLRGRALQSSGNHAEAMNAFENLVKDFPTSLRAANSKILWANSALTSGNAAQIPNFLKDLNDKNNADALLLTAKAFEQTQNQTEAIKFYRKVYFYGAGTNAAKEAEAKLVSLGQDLNPNSAEEIQTRADKLFNAKNYAESAKSFDMLLQNFPNANSPQIQLKRLVTYANLKQMPNAQNAFLAIPANAKEKEDAYYELTLGYAKNRLFANARTTVEEMRRNLPNSKSIPKTYAAAGTQAREAKNKIEEQNFFRTALAAYPNAVEVAGAQFELAWLEHESKNYQTSSQMLTEHLARYVDKDTTNRGKAGYWAARDSELAGKIPEACALYDGVLHRYAANWYGYLALQRLTGLRGRGQCQTPSNFPANSLIPKAVANLKTVTVAPETATAKELERAEKSDELSTVGLFDWAIDELQEAQKTASNSPKINLALAKYFRLKGDNVSALLALAKSYPDYSQMNPEEMGREEWDIFYPLTNWDDIKKWAKARDLDQYQVAGLIRQESVFNPRAKSGANAYGLMQLLVPTARMMAKKYGSAITAIDGNTLFNPSLNIELGTAYIREQFNAFGRIEYVAAAYNAGPGRVPPWRARLPPEMDEFVEAVPFKETKAYIQGVIRNSAQYRRLYDENGNFKPNVGTRVLRTEIDSKPREQFAQEFPEIVLDENKGE
ncbi:MAG TPA: transglycosylase SLT domain-containing protein [Pyrinomonadaceae bacterium]|nr:transglycosylase SLT domain-containing protein [Pyrinomonadaceae bacterium]